MGNNGNGMNTAPHQLHQLQYFGGVAPNTLQHNTVITSTPNIMFQSRTLRGSSGRHKTGINGTGVPANILNSSDGIITGSNGNTPVRHQNVYTMSQASRAGTNQRPTMEHIYQVCM